MIVIVETNFVLELALAQEEYQECRTLLDRTRLGDLVLAVPAFSIAEAYYHWVGFTKTRRNVHQALVRELRQLSRSEPYRQASAEAHEIARLLSLSIDDEKIRIDNAVQDICDVADVLPTDAAVIATAIAMQRQFSLLPQDATVLASLQRRLGQSPTDELKLFITRDKKDFANPDIGALLASYGCRLLTRFRDVLGIIDRGRL